MRLIQTSTMKMVNFGDRNNVQPAPPYAILSHRWQDEETTLDEMSSQHPPIWKRGCGKVYDFCRHAKLYGHEYAWADTCCIDPFNLYEVTEAINSMFRWYAQAEVCFAYLHDVDKRHPESLLRSEWFKRGWTLQELVAPREVVFLDRTWTTIGTKSSLKHEISKRTGISLGVLEDPPQVWQQSVAARMAWASMRSTTKPEDVAYSLLGIFGVSLSLIPGEGVQAFIRLQEAILRDSDDESILAWESQDPKHCGLLAPSPNCYSSYGNMVPLIIERRPRLPFGPTGRGTSFPVDRLVLCGPDTYLMEIFCHDHATKHGEGPWGLFVRRTGSHEQFARIRVEGQQFAPPSIVKSLFLRQDLKEDPQARDMVWRLPSRSRTTAAMTSRMVELFRDDCTLYFRQPRETFY